MSILLCGCGEFTFYINYGTTTTQVYPLNFLETSLVWEPETGHVYYRQKFQGTLVFGGTKLKDDFDFFWDIEEIAPCARLYFKIYKDTFLYWEGYFSTSNGSWDLDECTFSVTPLVDDVYNKIFDGWDIEYNILSYGEITETVCIFDNGNPTDDETYDRCRMLVDVIEYLLRKTTGDVAAIVNSDFFEDATNYVTDTTNHYDYVAIMQKSDAKRPNATNNALVGMMSLKHILEIISCMNLTWEYDGTDLRIEHISYWPENPGIDISTQKIARGTNKYKYLNETIPKYEKFSWMEAYNTDFIGVPIEYSDDCVTSDIANNSVELTLSDITTDLQYIIDSMVSEDTENAISDNGWVLIANENRGGDLYIRFGASILSPYQYFYPNMDFAWTALHITLFMHNRYLPTGTMNNALKTFYTVRKNKQQTCSIVNCDTEFDPTEHLTTELGETYLGGLKAKIGKAIRKPYGEINLTLLYGYENVANPGYDYGDIMFLWEELTTGSPNEESTFYAMLNHTDLADVVYVFTVDISDAHGHICNSGNITLTVTAGTLFGSVEYTWCKTMATPTAPYFIDRIHEISITAGWINTDII